MSLEDKARRILNGEKISGQNLEIGNPNDKWVCTLADNLQRLGDLLDNGRTLQAEFLMQHIIGMINRKSKDALKPLEEKVNFWIHVSDTATRRDLDMLYNELCSFFNENYLQKNQGYGGIDPNTASETL